ncbi:MAG TPA: PilW family protein [Gallionella sp.]|nr:PilW family protein [Gallionella sp.]
MNAPDKYTIRSPHRIRVMAGFTLIEMMVSIAIGLLVVAALTGVLVSNSRSSKTNERTSELQSNGRYALDQLKRELHHAGYRGYTPVAPESAGWTTPTITNECGVAGSFAKNFRQRVWGSNDINGDTSDNPFSGNCISGVSVPRTYRQGDVLVIRRAAGTPTLTANADANMIYLRSSYSHIDMLQGSALPATVIAGTENFALQVYVYYIGSDDNNSAVPALRRIALVGNAMVDEMMVSGIEQMQFEYGVTNTDGTTRYFTANNISGSHSATGATDWDKVSSVRIWLLARNSQAENGYSNTNTYTLSNRLYGPVNDSFRRQVFTTVVQLRNFRN